jgi:hypothetical protein
MAGVFAGGAASFAVLMFPMPRGEASPGQYVKKKKNKKARRLSGGTRIKGNGGAKSRVIRRQQFLPAQESLTSAPKSPGIRQMTLACAKKEWKR